MHFRFPDWIVAITVKNRYVSMCILEMRPLWLIKEAGGLRSDPRQWEKRKVTAGGSARFMDSGVFTQPKPLSCPEHD